MKPTFEKSFNYFFVFLLSSSLVCASAPLSQVLTLPSTNLIAEDSSEENELPPPTDDEVAPASEEDETNVDDDLQPPSPALQKNLYDPTMNYGVGSPLPEPTPMSTWQRNLIAFGSSVILGTIAMLVVAHNPGNDVKPYPKN